MWAVVCRKDGVYEVGQTEKLLVKYPNKDVELVSACPEKYMAVVMAGCCALISIGALPLDNAQKDIIKEMTEFEDGLNGI